MNTSSQITATDTAGLEAVAKEVTYTVDRSTTVIQELKANRLEDCISVTWKATENESSTGYYLYKKINTGDWKRIGSVAAHTASEDGYSFTDYETDTAGSVVYKLEAYSSNGLKTEKESAPLQIYTNPKASLEVEKVQGQGVEYIFDASGCTDYYGIVGISIDFGDGTTQQAASASEARFVHKYTETGEYKVTLTCENEQGLKNVTEETIQVMKRELIGEVAVNVRTTDGRSASGITVYFDLGSENQKKLKTDESGRVVFKASAGIHEIGVFGNGYLPAEKTCTILAGNGNKFDFTVVQEDLVTADFEVKRMTLDEIKAAGIDISAPENQHIAKVEVSVNYQSDDTLSSHLSYYVTGSGKVVGGGGGWSGGGLGGSWGGGDGNGSGYRSEPVYIKVNPKTNEVDTAIILTVPVTASWLKEFFNVKMTVYNNADKQFTISNNEVQLNCPNGLTVMDTAVSDAAFVSFNKLEGQSSKEINWILRGDEEGSYTVSADYYGILDRFNEEINENFTSEEPITVYGTSAVSVDVNVPSSMFYNQFQFEVAMTNNSPTDVYCASVDVGNVISKAFGVSGGASPQIYQQRLMKDGKYIKILNTSDTLDVLEPGYTYSVIYRVPDLFQAGEDESDYMFSKLDLIQATIQSMNGSTVPVALHVLSPLDMIVVDSFDQIPNYDPEKQFIIYVKEDTYGDAVSGVTISFDGVEKTTGGTGYCIFDLPESGSGTLIVKANSYETYTNEAYTPSASGIDMITLTNSTADTGSSTTPGSGSGTTIQPEVPDWAQGKIDPSYLPATVEFGTDTKVKLQSDNPIFDGMEISLKSMMVKFSSVGITDDGHIYMFCNMGVNFKKGDFMGESASKKVQEAFASATNYKKFLNGDTGSLSDMTKKNGAGSLAFSFKPTAYLHVYVGTHKDADGNIVLNDVDWSKLVWDGYIGLESTGKLKTGCQFFVGPVPIYCELGGEGTVGATCHLSGKSDGSIEGLLNMLFKVKVFAYAGLGVKGITAGIYGDIGVSAAMDVLPVTSLDKVTGSTNLALKATLGPFEVKSPSLVTSEFTIYDRDGDEKKGLTTGGLLGETNQQNTMIRDFINQIYDPDQYTAMDRSYLATQTDPSNFTENGLMNLYSLVPNSSYQTSQKIISNGTDTVMVYLMDDGTRSIYNASCLVYRVYDAEAKTWSDPIPVDQNDTFDSAPFLYTDGTSIYLIYQDTAKTFAEDEQIGLEDWTAAQNIAVAAFNSETGKFEQPVLLTSDSDIYDSQPVLSSANGVISAVWVSNQDSDPYGINHTNQILYAELSSSGWSEPTVLTENLAAVTELTAGEFNGKFFTAFAEDIDNDLTTADGKRLCALGTNQKVYVVKEGDVFGIKFRTSPESGNGELFWYQDGTIQSTDNLTVCRKVIASDNQTLTNEFDLIGDKLIWIAADSEQSSNLYGCKYDTESGTWGNAVAYSNQENYLENMTIANCKGELLVAANCNRVSIASEDTTTSVNCLVWGTISDVENLTLHTVTFSQYDALKQGDLPITVSVTNNSSNAIDTVTVQILDAKQKVIHTETFDQHLEAGETAELVTNLNIGADFEYGVYTVQVTSDAIDDIDLSDNVAQIDLQFSDVAVTASQTDASSIKVDLKDNGNRAANGTLTITDSSGTVLSEDLPPISAGETYSYTLDTTKVKPGDLTITFVSEEDYITIDNSVVIRVEGSSATTTAVTNVSNTKTTTTTAKKATTTQGTATTKNPTTTAKQTTTTANTGTSAAATVVTKKGEDGAVITGYTGTDTDVVIPDTIEKTPVVEIGSNAFYRKDTITSIRIPETVTTIGYRAFRDCDSLKEITIPDAVVNIGDEAFCSCNNLVTVHLSQSLVTLGKSAFYECSSLLGIELPNTTESIGDACFYNCDALTRIILPEGITIGDSAFQYCDALEYLSLPEQVTLEKYAFYNCTKLNKVLFDGKTAVLGYQAFRDCTNLQYVVFPEKLTEIPEQCFYNCNQLASLSLPASVKAIGNSAFDYCRSLKTIQLPDGITLGAWAFSSCSALSAVTFDGRCEAIGEGCFYGSALTKCTIPDGVKSIENRCFEECRSLETIQFDGKPEKIGSRAFFRCYALKEIHLPDGVTSVGTHAFFECKALTTVSIPDSVTEMGGGCFVSCMALTNLTLSKNIKSLPYEEYGFLQNCRALKELTLPAGLTSIGTAAFRDCIALTSIVIPKEVTELPDYAFYNCQNLASVRMPDTINRIGSYAFAECPALTEAVLPAGLTATGERIFSGCTGITTITLPKKLEVISSGMLAGMKALTTVILPEGVTELASNAFRECTSIETIQLPDSITEIGSGAFFGCTSLQTIHLPKGLTAIRSELFRDCTKLEQIEIPDGVTAIEASAFYQCTTLTSVDLPKTVESIGNWAFGGCKALASASLCDGVVSIGEGAFASCTSLETFTMPNSVTTLGGAVFEFCSSLTDVTLSKQVPALPNRYYGWYSSYHNGMFEGCTSLQKVVIPDSVTTLGYECFNGCTALESITLSKNLTTLSGAEFYGCTALKSIVIPASVTGLSDQMLEGCTALKTVTFANGSKAETIGKRTFAGCTQLAAPTLPETITTIGYEAFRECASLTDVVLPDAVSSMGERTFYACTLLQSIHIPAALPAIQESTFQNCAALETIDFSEDSKLTEIGRNTFRSCTALPAIVLPEGVTTIDINAFTDCTSLTKVVLPETITSVGTYLFSGCTALTDVTLSNALTKIPEGMFATCTALQSIQLPKSASTIDTLAFQGCSALESITIPESVKTIAAKAFYGCSAMQTAVVRNNVSSIGEQAFGYTEEGLLPEFTMQGYYNSIAEDYANANQILFTLFGERDYSELCVGYYVDGDGVVITDCDPKAEKLIIPDQIEDLPVVKIQAYAFKNAAMQQISIPETVTTIEKGAVTHCTALTAVKLPDAVTALPESCFEDCTALTSVSYSDQVQSIGEKAFYQCTALSSITIPQALSSLGTSAFYECVSLSTLDFTPMTGAVDLPSYAFYGCKALESITFTANVHNIGEYAFSGCEQLGSVQVFSGNWYTIGRCAFAGCSSLTEFDCTASNGTLYIQDCAFLDCPNLKDVTLENISYYNYYGIGRQFGYCSTTDAEGNVTYTPTEGMQLRGWVSSSTQTYAVDNGISYIPTGGVEYALYEDHAEITKWTNNTWSISIPAQIEGLPVTVIGNGAFKGLNNLEDVYFPSTLQEIGSCAFMNSSARDMQIPGSVERIGSHAFYQSRYSNYLTAEFVILGDGILYQYNGTANEVTIPSNVRHIGEDVFAYHREITDVSIPDSVTEICGGAFYQCSALTKLELPDYVERVAVGAFTGCSALKTVAFGSGIQEVDANAFCDCTELAALYGYAGTYIETFAQEHVYYFEAYSEPEQEEPVSAEESIIHEEAAE